MRADRGRQGETDARKTAGGDVLLGAIDREFVENLVLRIARIGDDDGVARQGGPRFPEDLRGGHRRDACFAHRAQIVEPFGLQSLQAGERSAVLVVAGGLVVAHLGQHGGKDRLGVAEDADFDGIVLADLEAVDIDLDELGFGDVEGDARPIGGGDAVAEAAADGEDDVGLAGAGIAGDGAEIPAGPGEERMILGDGALAHEGGGDRGTDMLGDGDEFRARPGGNHAATGEDHRALGGEQQLHGLGDIGGIAEGARGVCAAPGGRWLRRRSIPPADPAAG